jgi:uncharacterized membrane protein YraQ (UPF0718 family)
MFEFLTAFAYNTWDMVAEMAPYLIFGFAIAGLLHKLICREAVQRLLGKPGLGAVLKACAIGVPMPLCSCSVIPVAASLRKSGASRGATAAFLSSTPQTGIDSILATYALMGGLFTTVRVAIAFISGIVTGFLIELCCKEAPKKANFSSLSPHSAPQPPPPKRSVSAPCHYGFIKLPADFAVALLIGLALAGLITTVLPQDLISGSFSTGPLAFLLATIISLPLYICATASIPMAYALMATGLSPGAALIFLITGPATNTTTFVTMWQMVGRRATLIYLASLLVISWIAGWLFNTCISTEPLVHGAHNHAVKELLLWQHLSGSALILILLLSLYASNSSKHASQSCCSNND